MAVTSALVLYAVIWFMVLFVTLPLRLTTQGDAGRVEPGTPPGAPATLNLRRKLKIVSLVSLVLWAVICAVIIWGGVSIRDLDPFAGTRPTGL